MQVSNHDIVVVILLIKQPYFILFGKFNENDGTRLNVRIYNVRMVDMCITTYLIYNTFDQREKEE